MEVGKHRWVEVGWCRSQQMMDVTTTRGRTETRCLNLVPSTTTPQGLSSTHAATPPQNVRLFKEAFSQEHVCGHTMNGASTYRAVMFDRCVVCDTLQVLEEYFTFFTFPPLFRSLLLA